LSIGDFNNITWVNDVTELSKDNIQPMSDKIYELDQELNNSRCYNYKYMNDYYYMRNQREIDKFQSGWSYDAGYNSSLGNDTTYFRIGANSQKLAHTAATSGWNVAYKAISATNFLTSQMGDALTTSDFLVFYVYVHNAASVNTLQVVVSSDAGANFKYYEITSGYVTGWNVLYFKFSDMSDYGTGATLTSINYISFRWNTNAGYSGEWISAQLLTIQRQDPDTSSIPCVFQEYNGSAWSKTLEDNDIRFALTIDGTGDSYPNPNVICMDSQDILPILKLTTNGWNSFYAKSYFRIKNTSQCLALTWYVDSDNYYSFYLDTSNQLVIKKRLLGSNSYSTLAYTSLAPDTDVMFNISKIDGIVRVICSNNLTIKIIEVADELADSIGYFYLGNPYTTSAGYLRDIIISNKSTMLLDKNGVIW
jgi:hypothetical protein